VRRESINLLLYRLGYWFTFRCDETLAFDGDPGMCTVTAQAAGPNIGDDITDLASNQYGELLGSGAFGQTYLDDSSNTVTKIFFDSEYSANIAQIDFYRQYGGQYGIPGFIGEVPGGFQMEYIENSITLGEYIKRGGTFTADEVACAIGDLKQIQEMTGLAHGDIVKFLPRDNRHVLHPGNIMVQLSPGGNRIRLIDFWAEPNFFGTNLTNINYQNFELQKYRTLLNDYVR